MVSTASSESAISWAGVAPPKRLSDYRPFPFAIPRIELNVVVHQPSSVLVTADLHLEPSDSKASTPLILRGVDLELISISLDGHPLESNCYRLNDGQLEIPSPPTQPFTLTTVSRLDPQANTSLEGLYESGGMLTTQCEAEGFRRITFHPDRPDVLSRYRVRIEADRARFPVLLSNGNEIGASALADDASRHEVVWEDPFPKPSCPVCSRCW